jgi:hypothetical protein
VARALLPTHGMMILPPVGYLAPTLGPMTSTLVAIDERFVPALGVAALALAIGAAIIACRCGRRGLAVRRTPSATVVGGVVPGVAGGRR